MLLVTHVLRQFCGHRRLLHSRQTATARYSYCDCLCRFRSAARNALSLLAISVRRERLSRPPQTSVPALVGLDYTRAQITVRDANFNIRVIATRRDLQLEPGAIIAQIPQPGERVDCGTVIGVTMSTQDPSWLIAGFSVDPNSF
jgi:hypothetical protein